MIVYLLKIKLSLVIVSIDTLQAQDSAETNRLTVGVHLELIFLRSNLFLLALAFINCSHSLLPLNYSTAPHNQPPQDRTWAVKGGKQFVRINQLLLKVAILTTCQDATNY